MSGVPFNSNRLASAPPVAIWRRLYIAAALSSMLALVAAGCPSLAIAQNAPSEAEKLRHQIEEQTDAGNEGASGQGIDLPDGKPSGRARTPEVLIGRVLSAIKSEGSELVGNKELSDVFADFVARPLGPDDIPSLLEQVTALYREKGFFLAKAILPKQNLEGGVLIVQIFEGYVDDVSIEGETAEAHKAAKHKRRILAERPLKLKTFEKSLLLINDMPGIRLKGARLEPSETDPAAHRLVLKVKRDRVAARASLDNRGSKAVGRIQSTLSGAVRFGGGTNEIDISTFIAPSDPREINHLGIGYTRHLGPSGLQVKSTVSGTHVNIGGDQRHSDRESDSLKGSISFSLPLLRSRAHSLWGSVGAEALNSKRDISGIVFSEDKLRILRLALDYGGVDQWRGKNFAHISTNVGLDVFGASELGDGATSRADADGQFVYTALHLGRDQSIWGDFGALASVKGQYAKDPLPSPEEFILGGYRFGRGFSVGETSGEHGIATSLDVYFERSSGLPVLNKYRVYTFYDHGFVWNDNFPRQFKRNVVRSFGAGLKLRLDKNAEILFETAKPVDRNVLSEGDRSVRYFFGLAGRL